MRAVAESKARSRWWTSYPDFIELRREACESWMTGNVDIQEWVEYFGTGFNVYWVWGDRWDECSSLYSSWLSDIPLKRVNLNLLWSTSGYVGLRNGGNGNTHCIDNWIKQRESRRWQNGRGGYLCNTEKKDPISRLERSNMACLVCRIMGSPRLALTDTPSSHPSWGTDKSLRNASTSSCRYCLLSVLLAVGNLLCCVLTCLVLYGH